MRKAEVNYIQALLHDNGEVNIIFTTVAGESFVLVDEKYNGVKFAEITKSDKKTLANVEQREGLFSERGKPIKDDLPPHVSKVTTVENFQNDKPRMVSEKSKTLSISEIYSVLQGLPEEKFREAIESVAGDLNRTVSRNKLRIGLARAAGYVTYGEQTKSVKMIKKEQVYTDNDVLASVGEQSRANELETYRKMMKAHLEKGIRLVVTAAEVMGFEALEDHWVKK